MWERLSGGMKGSGDALELQNDSKITPRKQASKKG